MSHSSEIIFQRKIPIRDEVDILVAGGGPSGVVAAVAAARQGCRVFLVEGQSCLGGMGTAGMVPAYMHFTDGINFLAGGLGEEILSSLRNEGGTLLTGDESIGIRTETLKRVYDNLLIESGVEFLFNTQLIGIEKDLNDSGYRAILAAKSGIFAYEAKMFVDCTGDGDLSVWAGAKYWKGNNDGHVQPATLCSIWAGVNWKQITRPDDRNLKQAFKDNIFSIENRHLPGMWPVGSHLGGGNIGHIYGVDPIDERSMTGALIEGRRLLLEYKEYYRRYLTGYEEMELAATASLLGIRESRRIIGDYTLSIEDFKTRAIFDDEIGRYNHPVDVHSAQPTNDDYEKYYSDFQNIRYKKGESYGIPYRSLIPQGLSNVLVAGRCISCDRYVQGSVRVMPGCYITGQAAGVAAALAVKYQTDTRGVPIRELQARLKQMGAFLPNFKEKVSGE